MPTALGPSPLSFPRSSWQTSARYRTTSECSRKRFRPARCRIVTTLTMLIARRSNTSWVTLAWVYWYFSSRYSGISNTRMPVRNFPAPVFLTTELRLILQNNNYEKGGTLFLIYSGNFCGIQCYTLTSGNYLGFSAIAANFRELFDEKSQILTECRRFFL